MGVWVNVLGTAVGAAAAGYGLWASWSFGVTEGERSMLLASNHIRTSYAWDLETEQHYNEVLTRLNDTRARVMDQRQADDATRWRGITSLCDILSAKITDSLRGMKDSPAASDLLHIAGALGNISSN